MAAEAVRRVVASAVGRALRLCVPAGLYSRTSVSAGRKPSVHARLRRISVLVIEDSQDLAANIADYLEAHGYLVDVAMDGVTGLHLAVTQAHDVIVLD